MSERPVWSAVVCAFNCRRTILAALASLEAQDLGEPYEVIVVRSGERGCEDEVERRFPWVRIERSEARLRPAEARNRGVRSARGDFVSFVPDDVTMSPDCLRVRLAKHRAGHAIVGGAIANGTADSAIGTANYLIEYSPLMPYEGLLEQQSIPHSLSFERGVFERVGLYPEGLKTGEDTLFSKRCAEAGETIGFEPRAALVHKNPTGLAESVGHHFAHGRGFVRATTRPEYSSSVASPDQSPASAALRLLVEYPSRGVFLTGRRLWRYDRRAFRRYAREWPLVAAGQLIAGIGALLEWVKLRRSMAARGA